MSSSMPMPSTPRAAGESGCAACPRLVIDHLGLSAEGLPTLLALVEARASWLKATGFGRVALDVKAAMAAIRRDQPRRR